MNLLIIYQKKKQTSMSTETHKIMGASQGYQQEQRVFVLVKSEAISSLVSREMTWSDSYLKIT